MTQTSNQFFIEELQKEINLLEATKQRVIDYSSKCYSNKSELKRNNVELSMDYITRKIDETLN